jgi:hypothetical protein
MGISDAFNSFSVASRHAVAPSLDFGLSSHRYNARDQYRNDYSETQRNAAGIGGAFGAALPAAGLVNYARKNLKPTVTEFARLGEVRALRAAGVEGREAATKLVGQVAARGGTKALAMLWLGGATAAGTAAVVRTTIDDGTLAAPLGAMGVVAGGALGLGAAKGLGFGKHMGGKVGLATMGVVGVLGGIGGHVAGRNFDIGEGNIGTPHEQKPYVDKNVGDRAVSFGRGFVNHFLEVGPITQGMSLGGAMGMNDVMKEGATNSERSGAMHGDGAAMAILGGGALAVVGAAAGMKGKVPPGMKPGLEAAGDVAMTASKLNFAQRALLHAGRSGGTAAAIGAAGLGIAGLSAAKIYEHSLAQGDDTQGAADKAAGVALGTGLVAAGVAHSPLMKKMGGNKVGVLANSVLIGAALVGTASAAMTPARQFIADAKAAHGAGDTDPASATIASVVGGGVGTVAGFKAMQNVPVGDIRWRGIHIPKGVVKGVVMTAGTVLGAGALGAAGYGLSATMPGPLQVGASTVIGGMAGAAIGAGLMRGKGPALRLAAVGSGLGLTASALMKDDKPAVKTVAPAEAKAATA